MKRKFTHATLALAAMTMISCVRHVPVETTHYYHTRTYYRDTPTYRYVKPAGVSGGSYGGYSGGSPEGFQAVTPPSSYSQ